MKLACQLVILVAISATTFPALAEGQETLRTWTFQGKTGAVEV
jgi:hypothetical protein